MQTLRFYTASLEIVNSIHISSCILVYSKAIAKCLVIYICFPNFLDFFIVEFLMCFTNKTNFFLFLLLTLYCSCLNLLIIILFFSTITTEKGHFPYFGKCPLIAFNYLVLKGSNRQNVALSIAM